MEFFEVINSRTSIRDFDPTNPVKQDILMKILEAGRVAPSAANRQPWKFIIVSSETMLDKVRKCYHRPWFKDAPHILIVIGNKNDAWVRKDDGYNALETDLTIAMDHMILAAHSLGISTCWIAAFENSVLRTALNMKEDEIVYAITPLGYPHKEFKQVYEKVRKPLEDVIEFI